MDFDFGIEEIEDIHKRYKWDNISNSSIAVSIQVRPVICYDPTIWCRVGYKCPT